MTKAQVIAKEVDKAFRSMTTRQVVTELQKHYTNGYIKEIIPHCTKGIREAILTFLGE